MALKELQPEIINDYEHRIKRQMEKHGGEMTFPKLEDIGFTRAQLDDYLFDYQAVLDSEGSKRSQQTLYGIIVVLPVIALSAFPIKSLPVRNYTVALLLGVAIGLVLAAFIKLIRVMIKAIRLSRLRTQNPELSRFCNRVEHWEKMD